MSPRPEPPVGPAGKAPLGGHNFNLTPGEHTNFSLSHKHSGIHGDGQKIKAANIDWSVELPAGVGLILTTPNGLHSYRIGVANNGALTATKIT